MDTAKFSKSFQLTCFTIILILFSLIFAIEPVQAEGGEGAPFQQIVQIPPEINKKFVPESIPPGGTSRLTVYIFNPNDYPLSNVAFTDILDKIQPGIIIADNPQAASTCGGTVTAVAEGTTLSLTGGTVGAKVGSTNGSCQVSVNVTSFTTATWIMNSSRRSHCGIYPAEGETLFFVNTSGVTETLNVVTLTNPYVYKYFGNTSVWLGQESRVTIRIYNRDTNYALHEVSITDNLPDGW